MNFSLITKKLALLLVFAAALAGADGDTAYAADNETLYIGGGGGGNGSTSSSPGGTGIAPGGSGGGSGNFASSNTGYGGGSTGGGGGGGGGIGNSDTAPDSANGKSGADGGNGGSGYGGSAVGNGGNGGHLADGGAGAGAGGGEGGVSSDGHGGGGGGGAWWENAGDITYGSIKIGGGGGGSGVEWDQFGSGGGGGAKLTAGAITVTDTLSITGGNGGGNNENAAGGDGGTEGGGGKSSDNGGGGGGGGAMLEASSITVTTGSLDLISGSRGSHDDSGRGGEARLEVTGTVKAPTITMTKNDGALAAAIGTLDASGNDTAITLSGTAPSDVVVTTAALGNSRRLTIDNTNGGMTIGTLNVTGPGNALAVSAPAKAIGTLNAPNAGLTVVLPAGVQPGQTIVTVDSANLAGAAIGVNDADGAVAVGESCILLSGTLTGSIAADRVQSTDGNTYVLTVENNKLVATRISPVTGVTLDQPTLTLTAGGATGTLTATVIPTNAANQDVTWHSSNEAAATVSQSGVVTPIAAGTATITVTTADGGHTATCTVTVNAGGGTGPTYPAPDPYTPPSSDTTPREVSVTVSGEKITARRQTDGTYLLAVPHGTDISRLAVKVVPPSGASVSPASGSEQNFSTGPVEYTVTAENRYTTKKITVAVKVSEPEPPEPESEPAEQPGPSRSGGGCEAGAGMAGVLVMALAIFNTRKTIRVKPNRYNIHT